MGNSSFNNSVAGRHGGVMYAHDNSNITVDKCSFDNNEATTDGSGGAMTAAYSSRIIVSNSFFGQLMMVEFCLQSTAVSSLWTTAPWTAIQQTTMEG